MVTALYYSCGLLYGTTGKRYAYYLAWGEGLKYVKNSIGPKWAKYVFVSSYWFYRINLACACPLFLFHGTLISFIINLSPCQTGNIILSPYQAGT